MIRTMLVLTSLMGCGSQTVSPSSSATHIDLAENQVVCAVRTTDQTFSAGFNLSEWKGHEEEGLGMVFYHLSARIHNLVAPRIKSQAEPNVRS